MKNKKRNIVKKVLITVGLVLLTVIVVDICRTKIDSGKIPHRFASAKEGRELLLAHTDYYENFTQNDIDYRMKKGGSTLEELLGATTDEIKDFNIIEKYLIDRHIAKMARNLRKNGYVLPELDEIVYIKTDMNKEGISASGYTHSNEIYLNSFYVKMCAVPGVDEYFDHLLWHELFHCLTRHDPEFRADMYSLIHFTINDSDFEIPPCVKDRVYSNPDVEHHDAYATFMIDGQERDCFAAWVVTEDYPKDGSSGFDTAVILIPVDGTDTYFAREQASDFDTVFGTNTGYVTDPEECMADNFADAMLYGSSGKEGHGYPDPEIIEGIIERMRK